MASNPLLQEFPPVSTQSWEALIRKDLKGADYSKRLVWQSDDGLAVKPYYRSEDIASLPYLNTAPGDFPYLRGTRASSDWRIREEIYEIDPGKANQAARQAWTAGAEEIEFRAVRIRDSSDLEILLANLQQLPLHFHNADAALIQLLIARATLLRTPLHDSTGFDPFLNLNLAAKIVAAAPPTFAPFTLEGGSLEEAGATAVQEVGFTLAAGVDFLAEMQARTVDVDRAATAVEFSFAIGSNYFFQIAKLRAFRLLWARAVESFGGTRASAKARVHARSSRWNQTVYDPHVNILRGTTEAMSAALGGADSISIATFDECYKAPDEASRRLARNTQILLKQEAQLARVADAGGGSYYLEVITDFIAREAWAAMQRIEAAGGYQKARASGQIAKALQQSLAVRDKAVASRRRVFVGTNQYPALGEMALERIDSAHLDAEHKSGLRRGAEVFEQIRLRTERYSARTGKVPRILLAEIGDPKMRAARSGFAANFFGCSGFDVVTQSFDTADEIASQVTKDVDVLVLCSSDPEYPVLAAALLAKLKERPCDVPVIVAGQPDSAEQLKALGVADFISIRSNPVEALTKWQQALGVNGT